MPRSAQPKDLARPAPRLRRAYYDCRYGQLHIHNAIPGGGGFDELTPVICLHDSGETGHVFLGQLAALGETRSVYALDLPGAGGTDPAPGVAPAEAAVHAAGDFLDSMRIRSVDIIARGAAATAALRLLELRPDAVRRVLLVGAAANLRGGPRVSMLSEAEAQPARIIELLQRPV
jgi:pimeloyl-ACP methyl ester carboxylesterase